MFTQLASSTNTCDICIFERIRLPLISSSLPFRLTSASFDRRFRLSSLIRNKRKEGVSLPDIKPARKRMNNGCEAHTDRIGDSHTCISE